MNNEVKDLWVRALRSGEYQQGDGRLVTFVEGQPKFCCLGVLTDLYIKRNEDLVWSEPEVSTRGICYSHADGQHLLLPDSVKYWAGLRISDPHVSLLSLSEEQKERLKPANRMSLIALSVLNDQGFSFEEIAGLIEKNL